MAKMIIEFKLCDICGHKSIMRKTEAGTPGSIGEDMHSTALRLQGQTVRNLSSAKTVEGTPICDSTMHFNSIEMSGYIESYI